MLQDERIHVASERGNPFWRTSKKRAQIKYLHANKQGVSDWVEVAIPVAEDVLAMDTSPPEKASLSQTFKERPFAAFFLLLIIAFLSVEISSLFHDWAGISFVKGFIGLLAALSAFIFMAMKFAIIVQLSYMKADRSRAINRIDELWQVRKERRHAKSMPDHDHDSYAIREFNKSRGHYLQLLHYKWEDGQLMVRTIREEPLPSDLYEAASLKAVFAHDADELEISAWHEHHRLGNADTQTREQTTWEKKLAAELVREQELTRQSRVQAMQSATRRAAAV